MMLVLMFLSYTYSFLHKLCLKIGSTFDSLQDALARELIPYGGYDRSLGIVLSDEIHALLQLIFGDISCSTQNYSPGMFYLVDKELAKVLCIHLSLLGIHDCHCRIKLHILIRHGIIDCFHNIGKLTYT